MLAAFLIQAITTPGRIDDLVSVMLYSMICIGAVFLAKPPRWLSGFGMGVLVLWMLLQFFDLGLGRAVGDVLRVVTSSTLVAGAVALTYHQLFRQELSDMDRLAGAVFGYFLLATVWAMLFMQIELFQPGSFGGLTNENLPSQFLYFSMITITSLGYGDTLPVSAIARIFQALKSQAARFTWPYSLAASWEHFASRSHLTGSPNFLSRPFSYPAAFTVLPVSLPDSIKLNAIAI